MERRFAVWTSNRQRPNYLALWGADAEGIRARLQCIQKAATRIITAIEAHVVGGGEDDGDGG